MKIAGRKNDGAWFRTNAAIKKLDGAEKANLAGSIANSAFIDAAFNALQSLVAETGIQGIQIAENVEQWAQSMTIHGIPRQVWFGVLSWSTYRIVDGGTFGKPSYRKNYEQELRYFSEDLRKITTRYFLARRQARDLFNAGGPTQGNPGGQPDATQGT